MEGKCRNCGEWAFWLGYCKGCLKKVSMQVIGDAGATSGPPGSGWVHAPSEVGEDLWVWEWGSGVSDAGR